MLTTQKHILSLHLYLCLASRSLFSGVSHALVCTRWMHGRTAVKNARIYRRSVDGAIPPRSYSPPAMARRANNSSSGGQSSIILRASERERCSARWRGHPEHTRSAKALLLLTTRGSRQSLPGMVSSGLSFVRKKR